MKKTLYLVRHAKSSWDDPQQRDFDRSLNKRGLRDAPFMASKFKEHGWQVDAIVSSPANRAKTTASFFVNALHMERAYTENPGIYEASLPDLVQVIQNLPAHQQGVLIFGHNPGFSHLASYLTGEYFDLPTCSLVAIELQIEDWALLSSNVGSLIMFDYPKRYFA